jgi:ABC-type dipeptide/oligopeptide/nickel transport system permease subunit
MSCCKGLSNVRAPVLVHATAVIGVTIVFASGLSCSRDRHTAAGLRPGIMSSDGPAMLARRPRLATIPGLRIVVSGLAFNVIGDGTHDPRSAPPSSADVSSD